MTAKIQWPWETLPPGIYFNLPFEHYVQQKCFNAGGIKNILVSETDFWARSFMNPLCDEVDEDTKAKRDGRAYHTRILEGRDKFFQLYAPAYEDDLSDTTILRGNTAMTDFIKQNGGKGYSGKTADVLADMCRDIDPSVKLLTDLKAEHAKQYAGREFLDALTMRQIELSAKMIEHHPELKTFFAGGYPEVTVIWDDEATGIRYKIRIDYLKIKPVCDLKTFANQMKKAIEKAIDYAVASCKYHIQAWLYLRGVNIAKKFAATGQVYVWQDGQIHGGAKAMQCGMVDPAWLEAFSKAPAEEFWYVFQQKGIAPVSRGAKWSIHDEKFNGLGRACFEQSAERFLTAYNKFGEDLWIDDSTSKFLSFDDLPAFIGDV